MLHKAGWQGTVVCSLSASWRSDLVLDRIEEWVWPFKFAEASLDCSLKEPVSPSELIHFAPAPEGCYTSKHSRRVL